MIQRLVEEFGEVEILESHNDYFKMRVPKGEKSIGSLFGMVEGVKEECQISEYSAQQTSLEQIFQQFAQLQLNKETTIKFAKN